MKEEILHQRAFVEKAVDTFEEKWLDKGDERYGLVKHNNTIVRQQSDWLTQTLESAFALEGERYGTLEETLDILEVSGRKTIKLTDVRYYLTSEK